MRILSDYFELHGNVMDNVDKLPKFVHIHQMQYGQPYLELMSKAQVSLYAIAFMLNCPVKKVVFFFQCIITGLIKKLFDNLTHRSVQH